MRPIQKEDPIGQAARQTFWPLTSRQPWFTVTPRTLPVRRAALPVPFAIKTQAVTYATRPPSPTGDRPNCRPRITPGPYRVGAGSAHQRQSAASGERTGCRQGGRPRYSRTRSGPFPILVWYHGGGWVVGDLESADGTARHLTVGGNCITISVDYRLALETKFPGAADDCYAATVWAAQHAASLNGDPARIAVGGDSAGGNLAAAVSLMARDRQGPALAFQLLIYPVTDRDFSTASYRQNAEGYLLSTDGMKWYWEHYLSSAADAANPYAAPLQASDLSNLPAALVITAEYDPLCDEGKAYAQKLQAAGVSTTCTRYDGMIHGFFGMSGLRDNMSGLLDKGKQAVDEASAALRGAFGAK